MNAAETFPGRWTAGFAAVLLTLWLVGGCGGNRQLRIDNSSGAPQQIGDAQDQLIAQANAPVVDIPMPIGFRIDGDRSEAQVTGNVRYVSHYYSGKSDRDRVARFYREQMQTNHKWRLDFIRMSKGTWRLHFAKGNERCSISITQGAWGKTCIHTEIYPVIPVAGG